MDLAVVSLMAHRQGQQGVGKGYQGQLQTPPSGSPRPIGLFLGGADTPQMPSVGVPGGSDQPDQPTCSLCAPPRAGIHCDTVGGQMALPPLP